MLFTITKSKSNFWPCFPKNLDLIVWIFLVLVWFKLVMWWWQVSEQVDSIKVAGCIFSSCFSSWSSPNNAFNKESNWDSHYIINECALAFQIGLYPSSQLPVKMTHWGSTWMESNQTLSSFLNKIMSLLWIKPFERVDTMHLHSKSKVHWHLW